MPVVLAPGTGFGHTGGSGLVRRLQVELSRAGFAPGPVDGLYGSLTERAVKRFQASHGLTADGIAGPRTTAALSAPITALYPGATDGLGGSRLVRGLQRQLSRARYAPGPIDGIYGPQTEQAVKRFQAAHGLPVDGIAHPRMLADLRKPATRHPLPRRRSHRTPAHRSAPHRTPAHRSAPHRTPAHRSAPHRTPAQPPVSHQNPTTAPPPLRTTPATHPSSSPSPAWLGVLAALALGLLAVATRRKRRHREEPVTTPQAGGANHEAPIAVGHSDPAVQNGLPNGHGDAPVSQNGHSQPAIDHRAGESTDGARAFTLGVLLEEQRDPAGAVEAYRRADEHGHAAAASNLGVLLERNGDLSGAEAAYRRADTRGDANGSFNLAVLLEERSDPTGAETAYRRADEHGHAAAASNLGVLLERNGDLSGAEAAYRRADTRGDANGAFNLAVLLEERNDLSGAAAAYRRANQRGSAEVANTARAALLDLHAESHAKGQNGGDNHDE